MTTSSELVKQLDAVGFPAAPEVVVKLSQLLHTDWVTAEQLAEVAMLDAGVSARMLRLSNSVYYRGKGVKSIAEAVLRIGIDGVRDVVYALSLMRALRPMQFAYRPYWRSPRPRKFCNCAPGRSRCHPPNCTRPASCTTSACWCSIAHSALATGAFWPTPTKVRGRFSRWNAR